MPAARATGPPFFSLSGMLASVNIASRLEGVNKTYGTKVCVSQTIYEAVHDRFLMRPLDCVAVKGRKEPIVVYELMAALAADDLELASTPEQVEQARITAEAFAALRRQEVAAARDLYRRLRDRFPDDTVAQYHVKRCEEWSKPVARAIA